MSNNTENNRGPGPVPDRWLRCPRKSVSLLLDKFLIFKTPLNHRFDDQVPEEYRFPVEFVFNSMKSYKVKVGLWIDLTNTTRFYDKSEIEDNSCKYVKMQCKGHGQTPTEDQTRAFVQVCENFLKQNPLEIIGIHCTHGFNRSGFLVICYLIEVFDWGLEAAIQEFAKVRPPGIYKKDYLLELYKRYDDVNYAPEPPELPDWCYDYDDSVGDQDDDGEEDSQSGSNKRKHGDEDGGDGGNKKRRKEHVKKNPTFMEGIKNVEVVQPPLLSVIQRKVQEMCGWNSSGFPGSQPVSMDVKNIEYLSKKPYAVSWKADGVRYLMYIKGAKEIYCIDRDNCVFKVNNLTFPFRKDLKAHIRDTLLDGEMVMDTVNHVKIPRYLVYDIIYINGYPILNDPFMPNRYKTIGVEITEPRFKAMQQGLINKLNEPFSVRPKEFFDVSVASKFLSEKFAQTLAHEPDGLIFQPAVDKYVAGRWPELLKWKPEKLNSVDFKLKIAMQEGEGLLSKKIGQLYVGGHERPFAVIQNIKNIKEFDGKIIECTWDGAKWVFLRERTDKSFPNSYETVVGVVQSIATPVTQENLLQYIQVHGFKNLNSVMPPPIAPPPHAHRSQR